MARQRIAIVGGGPAALATAFELTEAPKWRDRYDIDVYTLGWRLGGKCASSRNAAIRGRNEEHGLHILGGFYHNVFQQLRPLYAQWGLVSPGTAIRFDEALAPHDGFTLLQPEGAGGWREARVSLPRNARAPGVDPDPLTMTTVIRRIASWVADAIRRLLAGGPATDWIASSDASLFAAAPFQMTGEKSDGFRGLADDFDGFAGDAEALAGGGPDDKAVADAIARAQNVLDRLQEPSPLSGGVRNLDLFGALEFFASLFKGILADRLTTRGFDAINDMEAAAWLRKHGASERAIACPLFQAGYHYAFAYTNGRPSEKGVAAGAGVRGILKMVFTYHGAVFFHMRGGMGEIFVTPYYEVLRHRGVRFHFFHRLDHVGLDASGFVDQLRFRVQARCAAGSDRYQPLVDHKAPDGKVRRVWPVGALKDQLTPESAARIEGKDLESWFESEGLGEEKRLDRGAADGFDIVVLAASISTLRDTTKDLAAHSPRWRRMLDAAGLTPTIAAQIWRADRTPDFHGWTKDGLFTAYELPHSTWANMDFQLALEHPDARGRRPQSLSFLCGPVPFPPSGVPGAHLPAAECSRAETLTRAWQSQHAARAFPGLIAADGRYDLSGEFETMYVRINSDPVSLYVTTPPGSVDRRLRPGGSGFPNLFLAGDWTRNNFDMGAVEVATQSGRLCAKAICGFPAEVYGASDFA